MKAGKNRARVCGRGRGGTQCGPACIHPLVSAASPPELHLHQHPTHTCPLLGALGFRSTSFSLSIFLAKALLA